ncbi:armadillo-type protein [Chytridium lagenaria]|nr:armadillo-type protein [Chytridium lagenaria]
MWMVAWIAGVVSKKLKSKTIIEERMSPAIQMDLNRGKPSPAESKLEAVLTQLMIDVGNQKDQTMRNLEQLVQVLLKDVETQRTVFSNVLLACILELPLKAKIYSWLCALLNAKSPELVASLLTNIVEKMAERYTVGDLLSVKLCLRFLAELVIVRVLDTDSFFAAIDRFISTASGLPSAPLISDSIVFLVLASVSWVITDLHTVAPAQLTTLIQHVSEYMQQRTDAPQGRHELYRALRYVRDGAPEEDALTENKLDSIWIQLQNAQAAEWKTTLVLATPTEFPAGVAHSMPTFNLFADYSKMSPLNLFHIVIFNDGANELEPKLGPLPSTLTLDRFYINDLIHDTLTLTSHNHDECSRLLLRIPHFFNESSYNFYDMTVESVVQLVEVVRRVAGWFALHLSNFDFKWKWETWESFLEDPASGRYNFIRETLARCVRLSYYDRIKGTLPESYQTNGDVFSLSAPTYRFTFEDGSSHDPELLSLSSRIQNGLIARYDQQGMEEILDTVMAYRQKTFAAGSGESMDMDAATNSYSSTPLGEHWSEDAVVRKLFVENLLVVGSKSFSHCLNIVERNLKLLQHFSKHPQDRRDVVSIVLDFWKDHSQFGELVLDKLMNYRIIDPLSVVEVVTMEKHAEALMWRWQTWPVLVNAITKANRKCVQIRKKLEEVGGGTFGDMNVDGESFFFYMVAWKRCIKVFWIESPEKEKFERALEGAMSEQRQTYVAVFSGLCDLVETSAYQSERDRRYLLGIMRSIGREVS